MNRFLTALALTAFTIVGSTADAQASQADRPAPSAPAQQVAADRVNGEDPRENAVRNLKYMWRGSMAIENTYVLVLFNNSQHSVDIVIRCYTRNGVSKDIRMGVVANGSASIGFLEGWDGNFVPGEHVEIYYEGRFIGRIDAPVK